MITNKWITGDTGIEDALALRREVFVKEQGVSGEEEFEGLDAQSMHLIIYDGDTPVAAGRVWHDGKTFRIGRCCVVQGQRGQGIGDLLIKLLILKAFAFSPSEIRIHAQCQVEGFYARYGFVPVGEPFMEAGIEHIPMRITKETMVFPADCGEEKHYADFFPLKKND